MSANSTYYYIVRPVVKGVVLRTTEADSEIKVVVPPTNMALVHRWMANQETCGIMNRTVDRNNNYRCAYTGPGNTNNYYDLGYSLFADVVETGCNFSPGPSCYSWGCINNGTPSAGVGNDGDVYYDRQTQYCYLKVAGSWIVSTSLSATKQGQIGSSAPGLPPLKQGQQYAWNTCQGITAEGLGKKRLPSRKEQLAALAWPLSISQSSASIQSLVSGYNLPSSGVCNTNSANGLTMENGAYPSNLETLPGRLGYNIFAVRTGSISTLNCISRYGLQDAVGNMWEWVSDQMTCTGGSPNTCIGSTSTVDSSNQDFTGLPWDGTVLPGGGSGATQWPLYTNSFDTTKFIVPLGLPLVTQAGLSYDGLTLGTGLTQFIQLDYVWIDTNAANTLRALQGGGGFFYNVNHGRYTMNFRQNPTATVFSFGEGGQRCVLAVP